MGIIIQSKDRSGPVKFTMGKGSFYSLRKEIGEKLASAEYKNWLKTDARTTIPELDIVCNALADIVGEALYDFLTIYDDGELTSKQCKDMYDKVQYLNITKKFGYPWCRHSFDELKQLLLYCYTHTSSLIWG